MFGNGYEDLGAGNIDKGAFYLCEWKNNEWQIQRKVQSPSPETNDLFAHDFDIEGENIIISAFNKDAGRGKVYFFSLMN